MVNLRGFPVCQSSRVGLSKMRDTTQSVAIFMINQSKTWLKATSAGHLYIWRAQIHSFFVFLSLKLSHWACFSPTSSVTAMQLGTMLALLLRCHPVLMRHAISKTAMDHGYTMGEVGMPLGEKVENFTAGFCLGTTGSTPTRGINIYNRISIYIYNIYKEIADFPMTIIFCQRSFGLSWCYSSRCVHCQCSRDFSIFWKDASSGNMSHLSRGISTTQTPCVF